ncbi:unnamed protein product [Arabidopsis halleri]
MFNRHVLPTCIPYFALHLPCSSSDFLRINCFLNFSPSLQVTQL